MGKKPSILMMGVQKFQCSQAITAVGQEKLGKGNDEVIRARGAFGGAWEAMAKSSAHWREGLLFWVFAKTVTPGGKGKPENVERCRRTCPAIPK